MLSEALLCQALLWVLLLGFFDSIGGGDGGGAEEEEEVVPMEVVEE